MIRPLEYRLGRQEGKQVFADGPRYSTPEAARAAAPAINRERDGRLLPPLTLVLTLPAAGELSDVGADPSHFLRVVLL